MVFQAIGNRGQGSRLDLRELRGHHELHGDPSAGIGGGGSGLEIDDVASVDRIGLVGHIGVDGLRHSVNVIGTAAASTGVVLPACEAGDVIEVYNQGANALAVYPPGSETINALSASAAFSVGAGKAASFRKVSDTAWMSQLGA